MQGADRDYIPDSFCRDSRDFSGADCSEQVCRVTAEVCKQVCSVEVQQDAEDSELYVLPV